MKLLYIIFLALYIFQIQNAESQTFWKQYYPPNSTTGDKYACEAYDHGFYAIGIDGLSGKAITTLFKTDPFGNVEWNLRLSVDSCSLLYYSVLSTRDSGGIFISFLQSYAASIPNCIVVSKFTSNGTITWNKKYYTSTSTVTANSLGKTICIIETVDSGYLFQTETLEGVQLIKTDSSGNIQWSKIYRIHSTPISANGKIIQTNDSGFVFMLRRSIPGNNTNVCVLLKTDKTGSAEWSRTYKDSLNANPNDKLWGSNIFTMDNSGYVFTYGKYLIRTELTGDTIWKRSIDQQLVINLFYLDKCSDNGFILAGEGTNLASLVLIKTDSSGQLLWTKHISHPNSGTPVHLTNLNRCSDNGFLLSGSSAITGHGMILKTDSTGAINCPFDTIPQPELNLILQLEQDSVTDSLYTFNSDTISFQIDTGLTVDELCSTTSIPDAKSLDETLVYPNPTQGAFTIKSNSELSGIIITDFYGRIILNRNLYSDSEIIDISDYSDGVYICKIIFNNKSAVIKRVVVN